MPAAARRLKMGGVRANGDRVGVNSDCLEFNGKPWLPAMGEFQYSRHAPELWEQELLKIKAGGIGIVATYVFWIHHEEEEGVFDWSGRRDLHRFVQLCAKHGLWIAVRIGPFCHGEARNGGLPDWLYGRALRARSNDPQYLSYVRRLYREIGRQLRGTMFQDGGPIIAIQYENEFMDSSAPWETTQNPAMMYTPKGSDGIAHIRMLKKLADEAGIVVPLKTCTGWGESPVDPAEFIPLFGGYAFYGWLDDPQQQQPTDFFLFRDAHGRGSPNYETAAVPYACCELGGGMQVFYKNRPVVPPESVEAMHVAQLGSGANLMGYYVYHGGSNPIGRRSFLNEHRCPRISYDFQAPLSEYGVRRPHYGLLRRQFLFLGAFGERLAPMTVFLPEGNASIRPADTKTVRWSVRAKDGAGFVFLHNYQDHVELRDHDNVFFNVKINGEVLRLPPGGAGLSLKKGAAAVLPFNFAMDGVLLKSASVQPITRIEHDGAAHYFFFAPDGFPAVYAFDASTFTALSLRKASRQDVGTQAVVTVQPGMDGLLTFTARRGGTVRVSTLTDAQSRQFWQGKVAGRERVFLSEAGLIFDRGKVELYQCGSAQMHVAVCPAIGRTKKPGRDGMFQRHAIKATPRRVTVKVKQIDDGKFVVRIPRNAMRGLDELFLQIDYTGDTGSAYLDGDLIADNFANGTPWEIGLKRFSPRSCETELILVITPRNNPIRVTYTSMAAMNVAVDKDKAATVHAVRAIPQYTLHWDVRGRELNLQVQPPCFSTQVFPSMKASCGVR
jgi:hypothetical protein